MDLDKLKFITEGLITDVAWPYKLKKIEDLTLSNLFKLNIFYAFKIYKFYKEINTNSLSSFQHILEMEYQMKYYRDLYQSYFIALLPIMMSEFFIIFLYSRKNEFVLFFIFM